ncbi:putative disease resistance RPP13-like protein 3 [Salvia hispanica]|uniref:putative disease resistance RPP13-like protein 3 n=1 Tax=Salvia hispanica TaxID=49212 RepID=UPI0020093D5D|nr:putative disease resistance RPP13-like protein 3 [Salvia hispanica]
MSEAFILEVIQNLESFLQSEDTTQDRYRDISEASMTSRKSHVSEVIHEMRMALDFYRERESGERSKLNYLLADFAEIAQVSKDNISMFKLSFYEEMYYVLEWMKKTRKRMMNFGDGEGASSSQSVGDEGVVLGLEKDVEQIIDRVILGKAVLNERPRLVISCIKGMIGAGKTTLARQVYNHPDIVERFKLRAWVTISSSDTSAHEVLVELIQKLGEHVEDPLTLDEMDNLSLQNMLWGKLKGMPYFIVLDNVPKGMWLRSILDGLPYKGCRGCNLLTTSRYQITEDDFYTHEMKPLDSKKSWQLFSKTIDKFTSDENKFSKELERKAKDMLKKCGGLPLAIIDVARQKAKQRLSGIEWEELFDSIDLGELLKLFEPVYHSLDDQLKACFLHMSFLKENATIRGEKLGHIWAAIGLNTERSIPYMANEECMHMLRSCIDELLCESIIEYVNDSEFFRYRINPLLYELSIKKAEEEIGFEILRSNGINRHSQNPRHRVIHCGRDKFNHSTNQDNKHLVSLIFHGGGRYLDDASQSYWKSFELLRILDMEDFGVKTLSETIGTLTRLRYLGLRNNYLQEIPHSLEGLEMLEVFDIAQNFLVELPNIINEMGSLRYLYMSDVIYRKPLKVDVLQNLEILRYISIYDWTYEVSSLGKMTRLFLLGVEEIDENSDVSKLFASLAEFKRLRRLKLRGFRFKSMPCLDEIRVLDGIRALRLDGRLSRLPSVMTSLQSLEYLVLVNTCLDEDPMPVLQEIPKLRVIRMRNAYTGRQMVIGNHGFNKLGVLRINELWNLRELRVGELGMVFLEELEIKNCPHLETLPERIGSMVFLRKFKMVTTKHIATKIRNSSSFPNILEVDISP